jgi:hypothetical protein
MSDGIAIVIKPVYLKYNYLYIPVKFNTFFPSGNPYTVKPIELETDAGIFSAELQYNSRANI